MTNALVALGQLGQSPWYDYITRDLVTDGELARLIAEDGLLGMTSNPTIFEKAVSGSRLYDDDIRELADAGKSPSEIFDALSAEDVRSACDLFRPVYDASRHGDGTVSIEVHPEMANDTDATAREAARLWALVDRPNVMVKIPVTKEGLKAITSSTAAGINVNITLLFSVDRHAEVIDAYLTGLEQRVARGQDISRIYSVASFFVSRVDTKVDPLLDAARRSPTPAGPTGSSPRRSSRPGGASWRRRGPTCSARSGPRPAPRTPPTPTSTTWRRWSRPTP